MRPPRIFLLVCLVFAMSGCVRSSYDQTQFDRMQSTIDGSTNKLLGVSLTDASRLLGLDGARWDEGYTSVPLGQERIYHFRGFYLLLSLQILPRGMTPDQPRSFGWSSDSELRSNGVWWVADFYPALHVDGLDDPQMRMSNYWDKVHAGFRQRTDELKKVRSETNK
jgi:hypothetical protein